MRQQALPQAKQEDAEKAALEKVSDLKSSQSLEKAPLGIQLGTPQNPKRGEDSMQVEFVETAACGTAYWTRRNIGCFGYVGCCVVIGHQGRNQVEGLRKKSLECDSQGDRCERKVLCRGNARFGAD